MWGGGVYLQKMSSVIGHDLHELLARYYFARNATFVKSGKTTKIRNALGYFSLCTSAPVIPLMKAADMRRHLTPTFGRVFQSVGE